jgi:predicted esterase
MAACDAALRNSEPLAGLILLSPSIICIDAWQEAMKTKQDVPVFMSHGKLDGILPFLLAEELYQLFVSHHIRAEFVAFEGGHTLTQHVLERLGEFIRTCISKP